MMMKRYSLLIVFCCIINILGAQIVINGDRFENGNLTVEALNPTNPGPTTGVLIPRVEKLNTTDSKADALMVYLDNPTPPLSTGEYNGYYYWDAKLSKWVGLHTVLGASSIDESQFFVSGTAFQTSNGKFDTDLLTVADITLDSLTTNDAALCELATNAVKVKKTGWYYIQITANLNKTNETSYRDVLYLNLMLNGGNVASPNNGNIYFRVFNSFAASAPSSTTFTTYAPVKLNAGDHLGLRFALNYKDLYASDRIEITRTRGNLIYEITSGTRAVITGKYLGNF